MKKVLYLFVAAFSVVSKAQNYNAGATLNYYFDVVPDTLLNYVYTPYTNETYSINLFGDASYDLEMVAHGAVSSGGSAGYINIRSLNPNVYISFGRWDSVYVIGSSSWSVTKVAKILSAGDIINSGSAVWDNGTLFLTDNTSTNGGTKNVTDWVGADKYIGLKFINGSSTDYGWIRVQCPSQDSCYVKDFSSTAVFSGIRENSYSNMIVSPNPFTSHIEIRYIDASKIKSVKVFDALGREQKIRLIRSDSNCKIVFDNSSDAYYFLHVGLEDGTVISRKIIKNSE